MAARTSTRANRRFRDNGRQQDGAGETLELRGFIIPNDLATAEKLELLILREAARCGYSDEAAFAIQLSMHEAIFNAFYHGNGRDPNKRILIRYSVNRKRIEIEISDEGPGFDHRSVPDPTDPDRIDCPHGRGIKLMQAFMDKVTYEGCGNCVRLELAAARTNLGDPDNGGNNASAGGVRAI